MVFRNEMCLEAWMKFHWEHEFWCSWIFAMKFCKLPWEFAFFKRLKKKKNGGLTPLHSIALTTLHSQTILSHFIDFSFNFQINTQLFSFDKSKRIIRNLWAIPRKFHKLQRKYDSSTWLWKTWKMHFHMNFFLITSVHQKILKFRKIFNWNVVFSKLKH